jgi:hypothetical protein
MITIPLQLPEDLAQEILPLQDRLPEIIALGLRQWRKRPALTPRQQVERLWDAAGLVTPVDAVPSGSETAAPQRHPPVRAGGKPASEIIIEERGALRR